ncbi:MAG: glycosyltransferase family 2 protein [Alphaproteobacteria bacterium]|nr:glycosyltransferase family 2 protein [Alphaproteobacteria bacterium]
MATLSVIIVAKNEAHNIVECVKSCSFADEILVLDSGSTDGTPELAWQAGARVIETDWPGYGPQQQRGILAAQSDWVLSLDADERISAELQTEMLEAITAPNVDGYRLPRLSTFCGQFIHHSGWRPDYTLRLVKRHLAGFTDHFLHAHMTVSGTKANLKHPIIHYSYRDLRDVLDKLDRYSSGNARDMVARGLPAKGLGTAISHALWSFFRTYVLRVGFLDGAAGLKLAIYNAEYTYYKYLKMRELLEQQPANPS